MTKPATPLPWDVIKLRKFYAMFNLRTATQLGKLPSGQDAAYIAHACNAYPRLVEALRGMDPSAPLGNELTWEKARALLRELGE